MQGCWPVWVLCSRCWREKHSSQESQTEAQILRGDMFPCSDPTLVKNRVTDTLPWSSESWGLAKWQGRSCTSKGLPGSCPRAWMNHSNHDSITLTPTLTM